MIGAARIAVNGDAVSTYGEQLWGWIDQSLQKLKEEFRSDPERDVERLAAEMWSQLGVTGSDGAVIKELVSLVDDLLLRVQKDMTGERRVEYLAGTDLDRDVLAQIELAVTRYGSQSVAQSAQAQPTEIARPSTDQQDAAPVQQPSVQQAQAAQTPAEVSDQIVQDVALPVLRELAKTRPDLVARHSTDELVAMLGQVIARRLAQG